MKENEKKKYTPPQLIITWIEMEQGIATGSAVTVPTNPNDKTFEEWETQPDDTKPFDWQ